MVSSSFIIYRHPDKNSDPEAQEKFIKINEAHEVRHKKLLYKNLSSKGIYEMSHS